MKIVGIDIGTNSIGIAAVDTDLPQPLQVLGSRIFLQAIEAKSKVPKNVKRRTARGQRRQFSRRRMRREALSSTFKQIFPRWELMTDLVVSPHQLRAKGLDEALTVQELAIALGHLSKHRGFKSNRKTQFQPKDQELEQLIEKEEAAEPTDKELGAVKAGISQLAKDLEESGLRTLGEYFYQQLQKGHKVRCTYTAREMYVSEFEQLMRSQAKFHPELTKAAQAELYNAIFWQRPLKLQKFLAGDCTIFKNRKRAPMAYEEVQRFRLLQMVSNLVIEPESGDSVPLTVEQRMKLLAELEQQSKLTWPKVRTILGVPKTTQFNLQRVNDKELRGNTTNARLTAIAPNFWPQLKAAEREKLIEDMLTIHLKDSLLKRLQEHWKLDLETAYNLAVVELEPGYARLSMKAIRKLLPHLQQGMRYDEACQAAGFHHSVVLPKQNLAKLEPPKDLRNPVVNRALFELRKVINTYIRTYGKPDVFRVELARDIKLSKKDKEEILKANRANEQMNERAVAFWQRNGVQNPTRDDKLKFRLWEECSHQCVYTGKQISERDLVSPSSPFQIEHIIPYSRCYDDSFANKTLCDVKANQNKGNRMPTEAFSEAELQVIMDRINSLKGFPNSKKKRFMQVAKPEDSEEFLQRQLNDTRYISREVKAYLETLGVRVDTSTGKSTALFRHMWGLNSVLNPETHQKNRDDHRHHAIDALVVALVDRGLFQKISTMAGRGIELRSSNFEVPLPWPSLRQDALKMAGEMIVSHQINRKITGALHEETAYGWDAKQQTYYTRKPIHALTEPGIQRIRDSYLRKLIQARLQAAGSLKEFQRQMQDPETAIYLETKDGRRIPVETVRVNVGDKPKSMTEQRSADGRVLKSFAKGNNHHTEILENADGERTAVVVSTIEAKRRAVSGLPVVQLEHLGGYRTVMSLCINDTVTLSTRPGEFFRVVKFSSENPIYLVISPVACADDSEDVRIRTKSDLLVLNSIVTLSAVGKPL